jgi:hypothetical protein|tara:strand:- start:139 stop:390 length:252 start_codon:yes stop_codon:yes gene_type:complete
MQTLEKNMFLFNENVDILSIAFEEAMAEDLNDIFSDYNNYIMDNADPSEVTICNGDTLLQAAENEYLLEEFKAEWIQKLMLQK